MNQTDPTAARGAKAEALLLRFAAEAHRRKWSYGRGLDDDGVPLKSEAFDALHRLGDEMRVALEELRRAHGAEAPRCDVEFEGGGRCAKPAGHRPPGSQDPHVPAPVAEQPAAETPGDTLPAWLLQRFDPRSPDWKQLSDDDRAYWEHQARAVRRAVARGGFKPAPAKQQPAAEVVHGCPPDGSGLTPCCGRTPFELPLGDRISSEAPTTCTGPAEQQPAAADDEETPSRAHVVAYDDQGQPKCEADCPGCEPPTEDATP